VAKRELKNVEVSIDLGDGISFYSKNPSVNTLKKYTWRGNLTKGKNEIPFVVKIKKEGVWKINTRADFEGFSHSHRVILHAKEGKVEITYLKLPDKKLENVS